MKNLIFVLLILLSFPLVFNNSAEACSCIYQTPAEAYEHSSNIFEASVTSISLDSVRYSETQIYYRYIVKVSVSKIWKGDQTDSAIIVTSTSGASCGYYFNLDSTYLVYGSAGDTVGVSLCSRTRHLSQAQQDLDYLNSVTGISESKQPDFIQLLQNYPNPFNPETIIEYQLKAADIIELSVYNVLGTKIATLVSGFKEAGNHKVTFNASGLCSGIYYYRLETKQGYIKSQRLIFIK